MKTLSKLFDTTLLDSNECHLPYYDFRHLWSGRTNSLLQMNRLSLRNNQLKFKIAGKLPIILEEFIEYTPI